MGLQEQRAIASAKTELLPGFVQAIKAITGSTIDVVVDWDALVEDGYADRFADHLDKVFFEPTRSALSRICIDDLGREVVSAGLRRIDFRNDANLCGERAIRFEEATLVIDHAPNTNVGDVKLRTDAIVELLENEL